MELLNYVWPTLFVLVVFGFLFFVGFKQLQEMNDVHDYHRELFWKKVKHIVLLVAVVIMAIVFWYMLVTGNTHSYE